MGPCFRGDDKKIGVSSPLVDFVDRNIMHLSLRLGAALCLIVVAPAPAAAQQERKIEKTALCLNQICKKGGAEFRPWELKLALPPKLAQCTTYRTTPFLAVILTRNVPETGDLNCDELPNEYAAERGERARKRAQSIFAGHTVFLRMMCVRFGDYVEYAIEGEGAARRNFLAVYARDRATAQRIAAAARRFYPVPHIVSMTAWVERGDETCR